MYQRLWPVAGLFLTLFWTELSAQQAACTLLTAADIEATTGEKGMEPHETGMVIPEGPQKGQKLNACMWGGPKKGMVTLSVMQVPPGANLKEGLAKLDEVYAKLRAKKWTEERKQYPDGFCSIMTPPPTEKRAPMMAGCVTRSKGLVVSSGYMSPTNKLSMEQTRTLLDRTVSHMH